MDSYVGGFQSQPDPFGQWKNGLNAYRDRERNNRHDVYMQNKSHAFQTERDAVQQQYHVSNTVLGTALDIHRDNNSATNTMKQGDRNAHHARVAEGAAHGMRKSEAQQAHENRLAENYQLHNHRQHEAEGDHVNAEAKATNAFGRDEAGRDSQAGREAKVEASRRAQETRVFNRNLGATETIAANPRVANATLSPDGSLTVGTRDKPKPRASRANPNTPPADPAAPEKKEPKPRASRAKTPPAEPSSGPAGGVGAPGAAAERAGYGGRHTR